MRHVGKKFLFLFLSKFDVEKIKEFLLLPIEDLICFLFIFQLDLKPSGRLQIQVRFFSEQEGKQAKYCTISLPYDHPVSKSI
jgi:hypothetical protein